MLVPSILIGIVAVTLIVLAILWRPSRIVIGGVFMLIGLIFFVAGNYLVIGGATFFIGIIFLASGL